MARQELHSDDTKIEQRPMPQTAEERDEGHVILVDNLTKDYADELAFMEEPVLIRLEEPADENAIMSFEVRVNGKGGEVWQNGRWNEITWLPIGVPITVKRKYLEVILRTKIDKIRTPDMEALTARPSNTISRRTSSAQSVTIIEDKSPKGAAWASEMIRRNF